MKKIILMALAALLPVVAAFPQGMVSFQAGPSTNFISYNIDGVDTIKYPTGNPANLTTGGTAYGQLNIDFFAAADGTVLGMTARNGVPAQVPNFTAAWKEFGSLIHQITPAAGVVQPTTLTVPAAVGVAAGNNVEFEVVAWTGTATTWPQALISAGLIGWSGSTLSGGALSWSQSTGNGSAVNVSTGASAFNGLVLQPAPEPSTFALGGLAAAALFLFRRRDK